MTHSFGAKSLGLLGSTENPEGHETSVKALSRKKKNNPLIWTQRDRRKGTFTI